jgi:hypothetical protein
MLDPVLKNEFHLLKLSLHYNRRAALKYEHET